MPLGDALQGLTVLAVVVIAATLLGHLFRRIGQPAVLGPIALGIAAGTAVAACSESVRSALVPESSRYLLETVGTVGLLLLMFSVGSELRSLRASSGATSGWRLAPAVLIPIAVCALAAWPFAGRLVEPGGHGPYAWLFVGVALGVTAVPVLVLIIQDLGIGSLPVSGVALHIAVVTDAVAWILVTALIIVTTDLGAVSIPALLVGAVLLGAVIAVLPGVVERTDALRRGAPLMAATVVVVLTGAAATQLLGFHPAIGAVIAGFFFPGGLPDAASRRTLTSVIDVLLPAFFVSAAMSVPLQAIRDQATWGGLWCATVLAVAAFASKLVAGAVFGALHRWPWRSSGELGVLLNCRGVTEIAIASVGFQAGVIGPFAYATLCGLAIATTAATAPLYRALAVEEAHVMSRRELTRIGS
ncbi:MAG: cation:proton antiporter [Thermoleophilia bacterium]